MRFNKNDIIQHKNYPEFVYKIRQITNDKFYLYKDNMFISKADILKYYQVITISWFESIKFNIEHFLTKLKIKKLSKQKLDLQRNWTLDELYNHIITNTLESYNLKELIRDNPSLKDKIKNGEIK